MSTPPKPTSGATRTGGLARWCAIFAVRFYQAYLSRIFGGHCRFHPTCSAYCIACFEGHGFWRGSWYSLRRLLRCHPWGRGGFDPPPARDDSSANTVR